MEKEDDETNGMTAKRRAINQEQIRNYDRVDKRNAHSNDSPQLSLQPILNRETKSVVLPPVSALLEQVDSSTSFSRNSMKLTTTPISPPNTNTNSHIFFSGAVPISTILNSSSLETHMIPFPISIPQANHFKRRTEEDGHYDQTQISYQTEPTTQNIPGPYISTLPNFVPVHTAEIVTPVRPIRVQRPKNYNKNVLYPTTPAESPPEKIFTLVEEPNPLQRKSYASENRYVRVLFIGILTLIKMFTSKPTYHCNKERK